MSSPLYKRFTFRWPKLANLTDWQFGVKEPIGIAATKVFEYVYRSFKLLRIETSVRLMKRDNLQKKTEANAGNYEDGSYLTPTKTYPFSFSDNFFSPNKIMDKWLDVYMTYAEKWANKGLPLKMSSSLGIPVPDDDKLQESLIESASSKLMKTFDSDLYENMQLHSFLDEARKFTYTGKMSPGWWVQDWNGKSVPLEPEAYQALRILDKIMTNIENGPVFKKLREEATVGLESPLDRNVGSPLFSNAAQMGGETVDAKLAYLYYFENAIKGIPTKGVDKIYNFINEAWYKACSTHFPEFKEYPMIHVLSYRSRQVGKPSPQFGHDGQAIFKGFFNGIPEGRVVSMVNYFLQILFYPNFPTLQAYVYALPGTKHDSKLTEEIRANQDTLPELQIPSAMDRPRFDQSVAWQIRQGIDQVMAKRMPWPDLYLAAKRYTYYGQVLIPDINNVGDQMGAYIAEGFLPLPSGMLSTNSDGTLVNVIMTILTELKMGVTEEKIIKYWSDPENRFKPKYRISSDDFALYTPNREGTRQFMIASLDSEKFTGVGTKFALNAQFLKQPQFKGAITSTLGRFAYGQLAPEHAPKNIKTNKPSVPKYTLSTIAKSNGKFGFYSMYLYDDAKYDFERSKYMKMPGRALFDEISRKEVELVKWAHQNSSSPIPSVLIFYDKLLSDAPDLRDYARRLATEAALAYLAELGINADNQTILNEFDAVNALINYINEDPFSTTTQVLMTIITESSPKLDRMLAIAHAKKHVFAIHSQRSVGLPMTSDDIK